MPRVDVSKLIVLIQERPEIWDSRKDQYHDRVRKDRAWEEVAQELMPEDWARCRSDKRSGIIKQLKTKWNSCRDQFRREFNASKGHSGDGKPRKKPYMYTKDLQFLLPVMDLRPTVDNLQAEEDSSSTNLDEPSTPAASFIPHAGPSEAEERPEEESQQENSPPQPPRRQSSRRRGGSSGQQAAQMARRDLIDSQVFEYLNKNKAETPEEKILRSLAPALSRVPPERHSLMLSSVASLLYLFEGDSIPLDVIQYIDKEKLRQAHMRGQIRSPMAPSESVAHIQGPGPTLPGSSSTPQIVFRGTGPYTRELFDL
ncbi:uncharacterized protein LOC122926395 [Bufo gargarizans]|uniref:uncharacterized protein LOC122926395 n=1 Tax=Bufo gargarizans TaxID=30331 RepID=UPI001CF5FE42|nr:uncharacterized protein LOC122926395 [Bufo gargarizans]